ncbi:baculoviral IAP repeat-containing protein 2-like [Ornithodoros turicata]|uniref:baculoviral IAP repeat-containing protein 2-like n=1 Tax=Ornithodoros turicata TaxID=34597 RepID=UPI003138BCC8
MLASVSNVRAPRDMPLEEERNTTSSRASAKISSVCPKHPKFQSLEERLRSFSDLPSHLLQRLKPEELANLGFFYTGRSDAVICSYCGNAHGDWTGNEHPFVEHCRWYPECEHMRKIQGDVPVDNIRNAHVDLLEKLERRATMECTKEDRERAEKIMKGHDYHFYLNAGITWPVLDLAASQVHENSSWEEVLQKLAEITRLDPQASWGLRSFPGTAHTVLSQSLPNTLDYAGDLESPSPTPNCASDIGSWSQSAKSVNKQSSPPLAPKYVDDRGISADEASSAAEQPCYPEYKDEAKRRENFRHWPLEPRKRLYATNFTIVGLYYAGFGDETICFQCGVKPECCDSKDDPYNRHAEKCPSCVFIRKKLDERSLEQRSPAENNAPSTPVRTVDLRKKEVLDGRELLPGSMIDQHAPPGRGAPDETCPVVTGPSAPSKNFEYVLDDFKLCPNGYVLFLENYPPKYDYRKDGFSRLKSYGSVSPTIKGKTSTLVNSGLFCFGDGNTVTCFHCGGCLSDWADEDDPFVEHCRWFPECTFTRFFAGDHAVNYIIKEHTKLMKKLEERARTETNANHKAIVQSVLNPEDIRFSETRGVTELVLALAASLLPTSLVKADDIFSKVDELCRLRLVRDWRTVPCNIEARFPRLIDMRCCHVADGNTKQNDDSPNLSQQLVAASAECTLAKHPRYSDFTRRIHSFAEFPHPPRGHLKRTTLASAGLFFTGFGDETICFQCGVKLECWDINDDPYNKHAEKCPSCVFIRKKLDERSLEQRSPPENNAPSTPDDDEGYSSMHPSSGANAPIRNHNDGACGVQTMNEVSTMSVQRPPSRTPDVSGSRGNETLQLQAYPHGQNEHTVLHSRPAFPRYAPLERREQSFLAYPRDAKGNTGMMAKCGFFYTGRQDRTTCFMCGNSLCSWVDEDDPLVEHARWFPHCSYVELMLGDEVISNVRESHRNHLAERQAEEQSRSDDRTETIVRELMRAPLVHRLLQQSIDPSIMELAIRARLNSAELIDVLDEPDLRRALAEVVSLPNNLRTKEISKTETGNLSKCVICATAYRNCVFVPCSHLVACTDCAALYSACPTCDRQVVARRNVFLA